MRALLTGILGMTAFHTVELLHGKGYLIYGIIKKGTKPWRLIEIKNLVPGIILFRADITNKSELEEIIRKVQPDEMYNFAAVSDVIDPYDKVGEVMEVNGRAPRYMLECISEFSPHTKFFQASSCLVFENTKEPKNEQSLRKPSLPYGAAKAYADKYVSKYREYGLYACSGIFFNHESERRAEKFFTRKVTKGIAEIKAGIRNKLELGSLEVERDMGYAPDYALAAWKMLQLNEPQDFVIGTGNLTCLRDFVSKCFMCAGLDYDAHVIEDESLKRKEESAYLADVTKLEETFNYWRPSTGVTKIISAMINNDISLLQKI